MARLRAAWSWPAFCCAVLLVAVLLANPFDEAGFEDDWSYGSVAMKLAKTGKLQHNGWGGSLLLFQSFWAVPWIRVFGFSFQVLQSSTVPFSLGCVLLTYASGLRIGCSRELAAFAAVGAGTCPLLLPFAASFMTESYACFFAMLCVYCGLRAVQATEPAHAPAWLWALALGALAGGANRQILWPAGLALIPWIVWERRRDSWLRGHAIAAWCSCGALILILLHFFNQPYGPMHMSRTQVEWLILHSWSEALRCLLQLSLVALLMAVPAFTSLLDGVRRRPLAWWLGFGCLMPMLTVEGILYGWPVAPYGNNMVTTGGISFGRPDVFGAGFTVLSGWLCIFLTAIVNVCVLATATWLTWMFRSSMPPYGRQLCVFAVFSVAYLALLLPGALTGIAYDRYMAPLVPLLFLTIMMQVARHQSRVPILAWACLVLFSGYAVAATHDHFEQLRASLRAAHDLERTGVKRNRISAGMEYDGWTQLQFTAFVRGVEYRDLLVDDSAKGFWFEAWDHLPNLTPEFLVLNWNRSQPPRAGEAVVGFHAWLPPFQRSVVVWKRADLTDELQGARLLSALRLWR